MDYQRITQEYVDSQISRVQALIRRVLVRDQAIRDGRTVPEDGDIAIGTGRRIWSAVLFLDIVGFSKRESETIAEQNHNLMVLTIFISEMIRIVEDYGGVVEKNTGDGIMAYFAPSSAITAAHKATACAMTMFTAKHKIFDSLLEGERFGVIDFRITVDSGNVTYESVGAPQRFKSIVAIGATANVASKMQGSAGPNQILVGENSYNELPDDFKSLSHIVSDTTGWYYNFSGDPYRFFIFTGRWQI